MTNRRQFLQTTATVAASVIVPKNLFARSPDHSFWFLELESQNSWLVADPVAWSLENAHHPILERCFRSFRDDTVKDVRAWIVANLDADVKPGFEMSWTKRATWEMV